VEGDLREVLRAGDGEITVHWVMEEEEYDQLWAALENAAGWSPYIRQLKKEGKIPGPADPGSTMLLSPQDVVDRFVPGRVTFWVLPPEPCADHDGRHPQHPILRESDGAVVDCPGGDFPAVQREDSVVICAFPEQATALEFTSWWFTVGRDLWALTLRPVPPPAQKGYKG
jgi:hypothetical protein